MQYKLKVSWDVYYFIIIKSLLLPNVRALIEISGVCGSETIEKRRTGYSRLNLRSTNGRF